MGFFHRQATRTSSALVTGLPAAAIAALTACAAPSLAQTPPPTEPLVSSGERGVVFTLAPPTGRDAQQASVTGDRPPLREGDDAGESRRRNDGGEYLYLAGIAGLGLALGGSGGGSGSGTADFGGDAAGPSALFVSAGGGSGAAGSVNRTATLPAGPDVSNGRPGEVVLTPPAPGGDDSGAATPPEIPSPSLPQPAGGERGDPGGMSGGGAAGGGGRGSGSGGSGGLGDTLFPVRPVPGGPQVNVQAVPEPGAVATVLSFGGVLGIALARGRRRRTPRPCR